MDKIKFAQVSPQALHEFFALCQHIQQSGMDYCPEIVEQATTLEKCRWWLNDFYQKFQETKRPDFFILYEGQIAGIIGLSPFVKEPQTGELGFWVAPLFQRKGIAYQSILKMLDYAFTELMLQKIECLIEPENTKSIGLVEKCGFTKGGIHTELSENGPREYVCFYFQTPNQRLPR